VIRTDLSVHNQDARDSIADLMNNMWMMLLEWKMPYQTADSNLKCNGGKFS